MVALSFVVTQPLHVVCQSGNRDLVIALGSDSKKRGVRVILAKLTVLRAPERRDSQPQSMLTELLISFGILGVCLIIHILGLLIISDQIVLRRAKIEERVRSTYTPMLLIIVFSLVIVLHVVEASLWAAFYISAGLFPDFETSLYFSLGSYSTVGYGDAVLPYRWRLVGTVEAISGVLLCGLSASFFFAIVNALFKFYVGRSRRRQNLEGGAENSSP
jgi:Ion channel